MTDCQKCGGRAQLFLCNTCTGDLRHQLLGLPTLLGHLADSALGLTKLTNESSRAAGFVSRTPTLDYRATMIIDDVDTTLYRWVKRLTWKHGYVVGTPISWHRPDIEYRHTAYDYAMFLAAHVTDLASDEHIGELCAALRQYIGRGLAIINRRPPEQFCGPCPGVVGDHRRCVDGDGVKLYCAQPHTCARALMAARGALEVTCPSCASVHRVETLVNRLLANADNYRGTVAEVHRVLRMLNEPVPLSTLYRWAEPKGARRGSGQLKPAGYQRDRRISLTRHDSRDKPIYRVSDARKRRQQWLLEKQQRKDEGKQGK